MARLAVDDGITVFHGGSIDDGVRTAEIDADAETTLIRRGLF